MRRAALIILVLGVTVLAARAQTSRLGVLELTGEDWSHLSEGQQGAYIVGAISASVIHGLRCPPRGDAPLITWRSLRTEIAQEMRDQPSSAAVSTALVAALLKQGCQHVVPEP